MVLAMVPDESLLAVSAIEIDEEGNFIDERPVSGNNRNNEPCDPLGFRDAGSDTKKSADLY